MTRPETEEALTLRRFIAHYMGLVQKDAEIKRQREREKDAEIERLREALAMADHEASVAHDAIWNIEEHARIYEREPRQVPILHSNDDPQSAQSAIWRLHHHARAALEGGSDAVDPHDA